MKRLIAVLFMALAASLALAQTTSLDPASAAPYYWNVYSGKAYADSQIDTSRIFTVGGVSRLSLRCTALDSASWVTHIDYRTSSSASWALVATDTVIATAATVDEYVIRNATTENVPGVSGQIRIRKAWAASGNGVTTATYSDQLIWRP